MFHAFQFLTVLRYNVSTQVTLSNPFENQRLDGNGGDDGGSLMETVMWLHVYFQRYRYRRCSRDRRFVKRAFCKKEVRVF